jgi:hypothetical protein
MRMLLVWAALMAAIGSVCASPALAQGRIIIVNNNQPGIGFNDPTPVEPVGGNAGTTLGQQRLNVFLYAAETWTAVLAPKADIVVSAQFTPLAAGVLGSAGPVWVGKDFPGAEYPNTWYHGALVNHLSGADGNTASPEINVNFSTNFAFYLGLDNNEPAGLNDLLVVALHEIGHGLGFSNLVNEATGTQFQGGADLYSQYTLDVGTNKSWNAMTDAERAASALNLRKVSWTGLNVNKDVPKVLSKGEPFLGVNGPSNIGPFMFGTAAFGPQLTAKGLSGDVVLGDDGVADPSTSDGCTPLVNPVAGKIVLLDRGVCTFVIKVKNAQDAGAIGVIIADNVAGGPPPGLSGADPAIVIPSGRVTLADGNTLKANLGAGLNVTFGLDRTIRAGTDRVKKLMLLATFDPVQLGSSISHFDGVAFRNQLMEPSINPDLTSSVLPPEDLTTSLFTDIGWFSDGDGVPDGADSCIGSDTRPKVAIESCTTKVNNTIAANGCGISDGLEQCALDNQRPLQYLACVTKRTEDWARSRTITRRDQVDILRCAVEAVAHH